MNETAYRDSKTGISFSRVLPDQKKAEEEKQKTTGPVRQPRPERPKRYDTGLETIDNFGKQHVGKSIVVVLRSGRTESGILKGFGMYDIALELTNKRIIIVMKHAIDTVSII